MARNTWNSKSCLDKQGGICNEGTPAKSIFFLKRDENKKVELRLRCRTQAESGIQKPLPYSL
jgi:hypothetical protein